MFGVGAGFQNCQLQDGIARNNTVHNAKGGSWPPTTVLDDPSIPGPHGISRDLCVYSGLVSFGDLNPKFITPETAKTSVIHQWDLQSLYLTPACPWAPPRWSRKGAAWDPHRCTRAHQSLLTQSPSSGFHNEVSGKGSRGKRNI